ncbi:MAG: polyphosphate polymerase domain-containing protein [Clostridia bacterium]
MKNANVFKRCEMKYLLSSEQYEKIIKCIKEHTKEDEFGLSTIQSLYYDTQNSLLIRRSIESPTYKEKIRVRSYGLAKDDSQVFVELKKKYNNIVFKRRIKLTNNEAKSYMNNNQLEKPSQIGVEIDYFKSYYNKLVPSMLLIYNRIAYYSTEIEDLRITFDTNIKFRDYDLELDKGFYGKSILDENLYLMEIKTGTAMPLWLARLLSENLIYKTSFSKYGTAYKIVLNNKNMEVKKVG